MKISHPGIYEDENNIKFGTRQLGDLPLYEIGEVSPETEKAKIVSAASVGCDTRPFTKERFINNLWILCALHKLFLNRS